jgi:hypothetical protein
LNQLRTCCSAPIATASTTTAAANKPAIRYDGQPLGKSNWLLPSGLSSCGDLSDVDMVMAAA